MQNTPNEIVYHIKSYLDFNSLVSFGKTCKRFYSIFMDDEKRKNKLCPYIHSLMNGFDSLKIEQLGK